MNSRKKILIVDDDPLNVEFFDVMFSKLGFTVEKAMDGVEAIEQVKRFHPDLIMLDNIMPKMSGWEVTRILKGDPKLSGIPIIMFSAMDDVKDKVEGFELGVDDYITKPFNFSEVLARIRAVLRNRELFGQIAVRESRLSLAEELSADMKHSLGDFVKSMDALDAVIAALSAAGEAPEEKDRTRLLEAVKEKSAAVRRYVADLDARIERTVTEWDDLKKNEIGLKTLETQIRRSLHQE
jgi:DNA-binding response OmpR family regulator